MSAPIRLHQSGDGRMWLTEVAAERATPGDVTVTAPVQWLPEPADPRHVRVPAPAPTAELPAVWVPVALGHGYLAAEPRPAPRRPVRRRPGALTQACRTALAGIVMWMGVALGPLASAGARTLVVWWVALGIIIVGVPTALAMVWQVGRLEARR